MDVSSLLRTVIAQSSRYMKSFTSLLLITTQPCKNFRLVRKDEHSSCGFGDATISCIYMGLFHIYGKICRDQVHFWCVYQKSMKSNDKLIATVVKAQILLMLA